MALKSTRIEIPAPAFTLSKQKTWLNDLPKSLLKSIGLGQTTPGDSSIGRNQKSFGNNVSTMNKNSNENIIQVFRHPVLLNFNTDSVAIMNDASQFQPSIS